MKKVLIVDDDLALLEVLEASLQYSNYGVKTINFCTDIFERIFDYKPDIVILDYLLTGINGGDLCFQIKNNPLTAMLPVIIITAYPKILESGGTYQSNAVILKPFDLSELLATIDACIANPTESFKRT